MISRFPFLETVACAKLGLMAICSSKLVLFSRLGLGPPNYNFELSGHSKVKHNLSSLFLQYHYYHPQLPLTPYITMASSSTASQSPPVIQPLPKLHHGFAPGTRVIHRRVFAENDVAILLEYAKVISPLLTVIRYILLTFVNTQNYNVDNAESLNKSALVRVLTTHNKYIPLLPHHFVLKTDGREIISVVSNSHDGDLDAPPSWFKGAISSLKGSKEKVFGAFMGKKVTKKNTKTLLEEAAAAEHLSDYASGDEVASTSKTADHADAS